MGNTRRRLKNPKVSIIIPVYNGSNYLKEAIETAIGQAYRNFEVIVVNDGSKDHGATDKIARSYGAKIRYFKKTNGGVSTALNMGIKNMRGEYFSWLSHDDLYSPDKIAKEMKAIQKFPPKTLVYCNFEILDPAGNSVSKTKINPGHPEEIIVSLIKGRYLHGCALLIPKQAFEDTGLFDRRLRNTQDFELWFRMIKNGYTLRMIPDVLVKSHHHDQQTSRTTSQRQIEEENYFYSKTLKFFKAEELFIKGSNYSFRYLDLAAFFQVAKRLEAAKTAYDLSHKYRKSQDFLKWQFANIFYRLSPKLFYKFLIIYPKIVRKIKKVIK